MKTQASPYVVAGVRYTREEVIHRYLHLVKYVAGRISVNLPSNVEINDLINDGVVGLIDAIEKYDDDRGVKFETYAITRIHGAIIDALRALDWVPRAIRQKARVLERSQQDLEAERGRQPTGDEVAERMGVSRRELETLQQKVRGTSLLSLEERLPSNRGSDIPLLATLKGDDGDLGADVEQGEIREALQEAVASLSKQERIVIELYYFDGKTLKDIKVVLGVSESRVSQIHAQAVIHLRQKLRILRGDLGFRENDPTVKQKYVRRPASFPDVEMAG
ncbi:MAG: FliA/WhiG family RNA polymerase sigma factor [Candidatus Eremiobacteraeota bacterium]|nr:FliA/WhiG family RNA polymerase sigma factor [Candidatus Eremiobacteraeota bacterium]